MKRTILWSVACLIGGLLIGFTVGVNHVSNDLLPIIDAMFNL